MVHGFQSFIRIFSLAVLAPFAANAATDSAYDVVDDATKRIMLVVEAAPSYIDSDPERYYDELQVILDEVVDFSGFARGVMGPFASKGYYQSLDADGKVALREQAKKFTEVMRIGLARTYGKGLLAFGGSRVEVQRPPSEDGGNNKASIIQLIYSGSEEPYVIHYQMRRGKSGEWKLRNLIVESINLGQVYRNQFQAAARDAEGDLDSVIDNWSTPEAE